MSILGEDVQDAVLAVLPGLPEEKLLSLLNKLASIGVESKSDLQFVKEEDLPDHITPIQCCRLLNAWNVEGVSNSGRRGKEFYTSRLSETDCLSSTSEMKINRQTLNPTTTPMTRRGDAEIGEDDKIYL
ncbi:hypothetical protein ROHU_008447 [Labeo rohita]|uniref:Uncharacterized protein n=1 Tax=Labeo rohita TaxID=84645 RepID=A0A498MGY2_LABRO|nr:hypothetical protein ROHU_008447 [Labeo rohita]